MKDRDVPKDPSQNLWTLQYQDEKPKDYISLRDRSRSKSKTRELQRLAELKEQHNTLTSSLYVNTFQEGRRQSAQDLDFQMPQFNLDHLRKSSISQFDHVGKHLLLDRSKRGLHGHTSSMTVDNRFSNNRCRPLRRSVSKEKAAANTEQLSSDAVDLRKRADDKMLPVANVDTTNYDQKYEMYRNKQDYTDIIKYSNPSTEQKDQQLRPRTFMNKHKYSMSRDQIIHPR